MRQALAGIPARVRRGRPARQHVLVEEMRERTVAHVVQQTRDAQRLDHQRLGGDGVLRRLALVERVLVQHVAQGGVEGASPEARLVHDAEPVHESRVLRAREDPARALQLADPPQPLQPLRVEQVLLGDVLVRQAGSRRLVRGEPLGQLDVPVDGIADEVDGLELGVRHGRSVARCHHHLRRPTRWDSGEVGLPAVGSPPDRQGGLIRAPPRQRPGRLCPTRRGRGARLRSNTSECRAGTRRGRRRRARGNAALPGEGDRGPAGRLAQALRRRGPAACRRPIQKVYNLAGLSPSSGAGAGQIIAIVDAYHDPNALSDLNTFNAQYGYAPLLHLHVALAVGFVLRVRISAGQAEGEQRLGARGVARHRVGPRRSSGRQDRAGRGGQ